MEVRVHIPHPWLTIAIVVCITIAVVRGWAPSAAEEAAGKGGISVREHTVLARVKIGREEVKSAVLSRREEILKYQLSVLEEAARANPSEENVRTLNDQRKILLKLISERQAAEKLITSSLEELWEAEGDDIGTAVPGDVILDWPVAPRLGISAHFEDRQYEERFGIAHHAIDIPTPQGTLVRAPARGVVIDVSENGLGYSYITLQHDGGLKTIYGHISGVVVAKGAIIERGEPLALSGGTPGTRGAGLLTTGPHVHFAVKQNGLLVDPLAFMRAEP